MASIRSLSVAASADAPGANTPSLRLVALLEVIAQSERPLALQELVEETALPKPTVHRMLQQLEAAGLLQREGDGRRYGAAVRLRRLAENLLLHGTRHGARHAVLRHLVDQVGESCNITALSGSEVVYLDRVETAAPLRFYLQPGSRVPAHCSASGKILLSQFSPASRSRLLRHAPLAAYTPKTITDFARLEAELDRVRQAGYAIDDEEFLPGLVCIAVLVPVTKGRSNLCVAVQAPSLRLTPHSAPQLLPALRSAAQALAHVEAQDAPQTRAALAGAAGTAGA